MLICVLMAGVLPSAFSYADSAKDGKTYKPSASARADIRLLVKAGVLTEDIYDKSFKRNIGAKELSRVLGSLQAFLSGTAEAEAAEPAEPGSAEATEPAEPADATEPAEAAEPADAALTDLANTPILNSKGRIVKGVARGEAMGALTVAMMNADPAAWVDTRAAFFEFLAKNTAAYKGDTVNGTEAPAVVTAAGVADAVVDANQGITREDMFLLLSRLVWEFERDRMAGYAPVPETPDIYNYAGEEFYGKDVYLYWTPVKNAVKYIVRIYDGDKKLRKKVTVKNPVLNITEDSKPSFKKVFGKKDKNYKAYFTVQAVSAHGIKSKKTGRVGFTALKYDSARERYGKSLIKYESGKEGKKHQTTVALNVWRNVDGEKVPATVRFKVNKAVAQDVIQIFGEYFTGEERFPIQSIGGFAVRDKRSEHNYGTAIDINPNENYMVGPKGVTAGNHWAPGEDPYSIPDDSELVRAFERHGWYWAGNGWGKTYDYMHFSYQGT